MLHHGELFEKMCKHVREHFEGSRSAEPQLSLVCRHGKHRSVAVAELFGTIFRSMGIDVCIRHKSLKFHKHFCRCSECNSLDEKTSNALVRIFKQA